MATEVLSATYQESYWSSIQKIAKSLRDGGLVAFPTETVYGLAASAENAEAVKRLRETKGRADQTPLTVHIAKPAQAEQFVTELSAVGRRMVRRGWPGPLSLLFEVVEPHRAPVAEGKEASFLDRIYYEKTVGLRCPDHQAALQILQEAGCVVVASSANRTGQPPAVNAEQVLKQLNGEIDLLLDGGTTRYASASTIVRLKKNRVEIVRTGVLDERTVDKLANCHVLLVCTGNTCRSPMAEGLLRSQLADRLGCAVAELPQQGYRIVSAGTLAGRGAPATAQAVEALAEKGVDISSHRSTLLTSDLVERANVILVMTESHRQAVIEMVPQSQDRIRLLGGSHNIEDPIGGTLEDYQACRDQIGVGLQEHLAEIV